MRTAPLCWLSFWACAALAQPATMGRNVEMVGASVGPAVAVQGDFLALGGRVLVDQPVTGDALLMAGTVEVHSPVGGDLRVTGGEVSLGSSVGGDVMAAAGKLDVTPAARVAGRAELMGGDLWLNGQVQGDLNVRARRLVLNGLVGGRVRADVGQLELGPLARVGGELRHTATTFMRDPGAQVSGPLTRVDQVFSEESRRERVRHPMHGDRWPPAGWWLLLPLSLGLLGLLVVSVVLLRVFSRFVGRVTQQIERDPWRAMGLGALLVVGLPALAMLLLFTLLGIPLGLLVMAVYPPLLLLGWLSGALFLARWLAALSSSDTQATRGPPWGWVVIAVIALLVASGLPLVGPLFFVGTAATGLGACALVWRQQLHGSPERAP